MKTKLCKVCKTEIKQRKTFCKECREKRDYERRLHWRATRGTEYNRQYYLRWTKKKRGTVTNEEKKTITSER